MADDMTLAEASRRQTQPSAHEAAVQGDRTGKMDMTQAMILGAHDTRGYLTSLLTSPSRYGGGNASVRASSILAAQRIHGNRAVQRFVQRSADTTVTVQREADDEETAKSVLGDVAVKAADPTETDTMNNKEYAAKMSGSSTVEEPKSPGEGVVAPDKGSSNAEVQARIEREKQDDKEIYERELRRAQQERIRDTSIPLNNVGEENLRGQVRDGAFTPLGGQRRVNPWGL